MFTAVNCGESPVPTPIDVLNVAPLSATGSPLPSPTIISPSAKTAIGVIAPVPEPNNTPPSVSDVAPVPPELTASVEDKPEALPVTSPSKFATKVATAYPVAPVLIVVPVPGSVCESLNNFHLPESLASLNKPE